MENEDELMEECIMSRFAGGLKNYITNYFNVLGGFFPKEKANYSLPNAEYIEENWNEVVDKLISLTPPRKYPKELKEVAIQYMPLFLEDCPYYKEAKCLRFFDEL